MQENINQVIFILAGLFMVRYILGFLAHSYYGYLAYQLYKKNYSFYRLSVTAGNLESYEAEQYGAIKCMYRAIIAAVIFYIFW